MTTNETAVIDPDT
jgi:Ca2+-binding EF-hand superfamily protein